jgi:hypothetical protein
MTLAAATVDELHQLGNSFIDYVEEETGKEPHQVKEKLHALYVRFLETCTEDTAPKASKEEGAA